MTGSVPLTAQAARLVTAVSERGASGDALDDGAIHERWARIVWSHLVEPGDATAGKLVQAVGAIRALAVATDGGPSPSDDTAGSELDDARRRWMPRHGVEHVHDSLERAAHAGVQLLIPSDPEWPVQLDDLGPHAPLALWVRGDPAALARLRPSVAVVGARAATSYGENVAMELAGDLAGSGIPIVSGAAYGIDGAAHRAALAVEGHTVALLAGGVDRPYPSGHGQLIERIANHGAVVGEVPCGSSPTKWRFLQRNRLIAALADATVVVEAGWRSGSLNTAAHALTLGRALGAVPGPVTSAASAGCHRLLRDSGAMCVTNADEVRELLDHGAAEAVGVPRDEDARPRTDDSTRVRDALSTRSWREAEEIARRAGMSTGEVEAILGLMMLSRDVERSLMGWRLARSAERRDR